MSPGIELPVDGAPCTFEHLGWRCDGRGLLRLGTLGTKPCPRCNTGAFLLDAQRGPLDLRTSTGCICCAPPLIRVQWTSALDLAERCNPAAAADFLARMSHAGEHPMQMGLAPDIDDYLGEFGALTPDRR